MTVSASERAADRGTRRGADLHVAGLETGYLANSVVFDLALKAKAGQVTAILGHNGAGKSATLRAIAGLLPLRKGSVSLDGQTLTGRDRRSRIDDGIIYLPQDKAVFAGMSVRQNLLLGATREPDREVRGRRLDLVHELFPLLAERPRFRAGDLSGGQQRMLSIGMALMAGPRVLLLDEPSLGLAPVLVENVLRTVRHLADSAGLAVVLVEQVVGQALSVADHVYVLRSGSVVDDLEGEAARAREDWWTVF